MLVTQHGRICAKKGAVTVYSQRFVRATSQAYCKGARCVVVRCSRLACKAADMCLVADESWWAY